MSEHIFFRFRRDKHLYDAKFIRRDDQLFSCCTHRLEKKIF